MSTLPYRENDWERAIPAAALSEPAWRQYLAPWPDLIDQPWRLLAGGLRTTNVRIGDVVVRIDQAGYGALPKEAALLRRVAAADVRVPHLIDATDDALLLEYVEHAELPDSEFAGACAGRAAAAIHSHAFGRAGFLDADLQIPDPFSSAYDGLRAWGEEQLAHERLAPWRQRIRAAWDRAESRMREVSENPVLVHADFKPANVKWLPRERDVVVFDWEFAWSGPALMDLGQMIRWEVPDAFARGLERGYGDLPRDWQRLGELFDLFNLSAFVADGDARPIRTRDAIRRIEQTLCAHP